MTDRQTAASPPGPTHDAPYRGLRVLDFGQGVASPYCGFLLAAYGADVIKVEPPEGDWSRRLGTAYGDHSALSAVYNRGKRNLCLDLKNAQALEVARRLARAADVFIEGLRPGVMARLGLGYETLSRDNPRLIYVSISGFGQHGPYMQRPASDSIAQAFSGLISINVGEDGTPHRIGHTISDVTTGLYAFQAVTTALFARAAVGTGRWLDVSLTQSTAALLGHKIAEHALEGGAPRALNVPAGTYRTRDGWLMVTLVKETQYRRLCAELERPDLATDPRFSDFARRADNAATLMRELRIVFARDTTETWLAKLLAADILAERILDPSEWLANPHVRHVGGALCTDTPGMGPVHVARTPGTIGETEGALDPAPDVGQHSRMILREAGYDVAVIDDLIRGGAVRAPA
jgi:crotonobetainyl-CoA:carnitine CoA-transferase CaiB-like acyl-CoA transferase